MLIELDTANTCEYRVGFTLLIADIREELVNITTDWQGCHNFYFAKSPMHICDMKQFTDALGNIRGLALAYFDGEFCVAPLREDEVAKNIAEIQDIIRAKFSEMETH